MREFYNSTRVITKQFPDWTWHGPRHGPDCAHYTVWRDKDTKNKIAVYFYVDGRCHIDLNLRASGMWLNVADPDFIEKLSELLREQTPSNP
jgi:hypothetical protein